MEGRAGSAPSVDLGDALEASESPQAEDDFSRWMDERGIIGLGEAEEEPPVWEPKDQPSPEDDTLGLEDLSHRLLELMDSESLCQSPREDRLPLAFHLEKARDSDSVGEDCFDEEEGCENEDSWQQAESQPERDRQLELATEEPDRTMGVLSNLLLHGGLEESSLGCRSVEEETYKLTSTPISHRYGGVEKYSPPPSRSSGTLTSGGNWANQQGVGSEVSSWPRSGLTSCSYPVLVPQKVKPKSLPSELLLPADKSTPEATLKQHHSPGSKGSESHRMTGAKGNPTLDGSRRGRLSHPLPDFSKVKPKVRFPKRGYKPPRSRNSAPHRAPIPKSPADMVREALLSGTEGPPTTGSPSCRSVAVLPEFSSPRQAHALVSQLQEDYNRLLTKYAEAENTIDRLRLEAKVNLYSDPPKPCHSVYLGAISESSKVKNLTFPQPQRAEYRHIAVPLDPSKLRQDGAGRAASSSEASPSSQSLGPPVRQRPTEALAGQSERFQMQLDSFEDFVKKRKLTPFQQMEGLSDLACGLDALERGYLEARDEQHVQQQRDGNRETFDPDRELEGFIFRLGMRLEGMREQMDQGEQMASDQPLPGSSRFPPSVPDPVSGQCQTDSPAPVPQTPLFPVQCEAVSPPGEECKGEGLQSALLHQKLWLELQEADCDCNSQVDYHQSFRDPGPPYLGQGSEVTGRTVTRPPTGDADMACSGNGRMALRQREWGTPPLLLKEAVEVESGLLPPHASRSLNIYPPQPCLRGVHTWGLSQKSNGATEGDKLQSGHRRAPPLDGVISPEMDSGFVGSEKSRLTPVVHSPPQSRVGVRPGDHLVEVETHYQPTPAQPTLVLGPTSPPSQGHSRRGNGVPSSCTSRASCPQHWNSSSVRMTADPTPSVSEEEDSQADHTPLPTTQQRSPSPIAANHPVGRFRAQLTDRHEAIQSLRREMSRLRDGLEASLRRAATPPCAPEGPPHHGGFPACTSPSRISKPPADRGGREGVGQEADEEERCTEEWVGPVSRRRRASFTPRKRHVLHIATDSEHAAMTSKSGSTRNIFTRGRVRLDAALHRGRGHLCHLTFSSGSDESVPWDDRGSACPHFLSAQNGGATVSHRSGARSTRNGLCRDPVRPHGVREGDREGPSLKRNSGSTPRGCRPVKALHKSFVAAPPPPFHSSVPVVHCVPVCPSAWYYSCPVLKAGSIYLHSFNQPLGGAKVATGESYWKRHCRTASPPLSDTDSLGQSLSRAIEAAASMRTASHRMARSLAAGLHRQGALAQLVPH